MLKIADINVKNRLKVLKKCLFPQTSVWEKGVILCMYVTGLVKYHVEHYFYGNSSIFLFLTHARNNSCITARASALTTIENSHTQQPVPEQLSVGHTNICSVTPHD